MQTAMELRHPSDDPADRPLLTALGDVFTAGQRVVADRIEMGFVGVRAALDASVDTALLSLIALALLATAWLALNAGAALALTARLSAPMSLAAVAAINAVLALLVGVLAMRSRRRGRGIGME